MTDAERMKSIIAELEHDYIGYDNLHGDNEHGCRVIKEALEKAEKYRWHDLRKNPDDLPDTTRKIELVVNVLGVNFEEHGYYSFERKAFKLQHISTAYDKNSDGMWQDECPIKKNMEVIAWREIEPFEEVR